MTSNETSVGEKAEAMLVEQGLTEIGEPIGCDEDEIQDLEEEFDVELPEAYRSFLRHMGQAAGDFLLGTEAFYPAVKAQKSHAEKRIEEHDADFEFDENDFVFLGHQGYSFNFFNTKDGEDPPVYHYLEGEDEAEKIANSFSEWLFAEIRR